MNNIYMITGFISKGQELDWIFQIWVLIRSFFVQKELIVGAGRPLYLLKHVLANQFLSAIVNNSHQGCLNTISKHQIGVSGFRDIINYFGLSFDYILALEDDCTPLNRPKTCTDIPVFIKFVNDIQYRYATQYKRQEGWIFTIPGVKQTIFCLFLTKY